jgi:hypothetical protein
MRAHCRAGQIFCALFYGVDVAHVVATHGQAEAPATSTEFAARLKGCRRQGQARDPAPLVGAEVAEAGKFLRQPLF